jgi:hypothetical protein
MICAGDLVQDWMGRPGIAIEKTDPPTLDAFGPVFGSPLSELGEETTWWSVALIEGGVCNSPQSLTDSWGRAGKAALRMATKHCRPSVRSQLDALLALPESDRSAECRRPH